MADNNTKIVISAEDRASTAIKSVGNSLGQLNTAASALIPQMGAFASAASAGAMLAWSKSVIDAADNINDMSQRIGVSVKTLGEWKLAAEQNGTTLETMATGIKNLSVYMVDHADRLRDAGVASKDVKGALMELSDIFKAMPEGPERTALAMEIFKKAGMDMLPVMLQGSKGLAEAAEKSATYAARLAELAPKADKFNDAMAELGMQSKVAGMTIADSLVGPMTDLVTLMNKLAAGGPKAREAVEGLMNSRSPLVRGVATLSHWFNRDNAAYTGREVVGKIRGREGDLALPGENSPAEISALARAKILNPSSGVKSGDTELKKMVAKGQQNLMDDYYKYSSEEDMQSAIYKNSEKSILAAKREQEETDKLREKYLQLADPLKKYKDELDEVNRLRSDGVLSAEEALAAESNIAKAMDETAGRMSGLKEISKELGMTFSSAFEDAIVGGKKFSEVLQGIGQDIIRLVMRKNVTEPLANIVSKFDWASLFSANADGGVYRSPSLSAYSGQIVSRPTLFAFANGAGIMGEAGSEAILPLKRGADGKLGVASSGGGAGGVVVNIIESPGNGGKQQRRNENGVNILDVFVEKVKSSLATDIVDGRGAVPAAMSSAYGLNRAAGAY